MGLSVMFDTYILYYNLLNYYYNRLHIQIKQTKNQTKQLIKHSLSTNIVRISTLFFLVFLFHTAICLLALLQGKHHSILIYIVDEKEGTS